MIFCTGICWPWMAVNACAGLVELLPMWLAPNLVTLAGTACVLFAYILNIFYIPTFVDDGASTQANERWQLLDFRVRL